MQRNKRVFTFPVRKVKTRNLSVLLVCFITSLLLSCDANNANNEIQSSSQNSSNSTKGTVTDFNVSGVYYAGIYISSADSRNQTGFYPNTYPKTVARLELLQLRPNNHEITVKLDAKFYERNESSTYPSLWLLIGRILGMGRGTLTKGTGSNYGTYLVNFNVEDNFIDSDGAPTTAILSFSFEGKVAQFTHPTSSISESPISTNNFLALTGTMTIEDANHKVFLSNTTTKRMAAKRWRMETFQPF